MPKATFIADILEEHLEELAFLWGQRRTALRSPLYSLEKFCDLEERIEAHVQGLLVQKDQILALAGPALKSEDPLEAFAAGYSLVRAGQADVVTESPAAGAVREALGQDPEAGAAQIETWLSAESPALRCAGWRAAAQVRHSPSPNLYASAMRDEDANVRRESMLAAAWLRQPGVLEVCRRLAANPAPEHADAYVLLGVLGVPRDLPAIMELGKAEVLGPRRFQALGAFGHPETVSLLLDGMPAPDPASAAAAGAAFTKMTGADVGSGQRAAIQPAGGEPDEFEKEFLDEVVLPDPQRARDHWNKVRESFAGATRIARGLVLSPGPGWPIPASLDMESRWEAHLRARFEGLWDGRPSDLERYPLAL